MAVVSYAHVLLSEGFEAALAQHVLWGFMLIVIATYGPGKVSLDYLLVRDRAGASLQRDPSGADLSMRFVTAGQAFSPCRTMDRLSVANIP